MDKLEKHLEFCKKYPQLCEYKQFNKKVFPIIDYIFVGELINIFNKNPDVFLEYKNLKEDWNNLIIPIINFNKPIKKVKNINLIFV